MRGSARLWRHAFVVVTFFSGQVLAEPPGQARLSAYSAVEGCPSAAEWHAGLRARLPESLREHPALQALSVTLRRGGGEGAERFEGELGAVGDSPASRTLSGSVCAEVADALTLVAALEAQRTAYLDGRAASPLELVNETRPRTEPADAPIERAGVLAPRRLGVVGFALVQSATAPRWGADAGLGLSVDWHARAWQPWLMLGGYWGSDDEQVGSGPARARFERWAALVVGCPLRYPIAVSLAVRPCVSVDLGKISGGGRGVGAPAESAALLANAGLEARLELSVSEHVQLGALAGGVLAVSRPRFFFAPDHTALSVPALGVRTGASASLSF